MPVVRSTTCDSASTTVVPAFVEGGLMTSKHSRNYFLSFVHAAVASGLAAILFLFIAQGVSQTLTQKRVRRTPVPVGISTADRGRVPRVEAEPDSTRPLLSPPSIVFLPPVFYDTGGYSPYTGSAAVADFNGDRKPDFAHANLCADSSCTTNGNVAVFMGNGDGTFQGAVLYDAGGIYTEFVAAADVNNDGKPDLLVANTLSNTVGVLLGKGDGTFRPVVTYPTGGTMPNAVAVADVNGDSTPDLIATNSNSGTVGVLLGNGDGTFQPVKTYGAGGAWPISLAVADVDGDGKLDVVVANLDTDTAGVLIGNGDGSFQPAVTYSLGNFGVASITVADINRDGKPDLILANCDLGDDNTCIDEKRDGAVSVLLGNGDGTFEPA